MTDTKTWFHEFTTEFIAYMTVVINLKKQLLMPYTKLVAKMRTVNPAATKGMVVKQINNMLSLYRKFKEN